MPDRIVVDLFCEDGAHERLLRPLIRRIADEVAVEVTVQVVAAQRGQGRAMSEFRVYRDAVKRQQRGARLVTVAIDGNCVTWAARRKEIRHAAGGELRDRLVVACPNPHIERWYLADPASFRDVVGRGPGAVPEDKCERGLYKRLLFLAVREAGHVSRLGGLEFAEDLAFAMDLYRAGKNDPSLKAFLDDLRAALHGLARDSGGAF